MKQGYFSIPTLFILQVLKSAILGKIQIHLWEEAKCNACGCQSVFSLAATSHCSSGLTLYHLEEGAQLGRDSPERTSSDQSMGKAESFGAQ